MYITKPSYIISKSDIILPTDSNFILPFITCSICNNIIIEPIQCNICNNYFCQICINNWLQRNAHCFKCKNSENFNKSKIMQRLLSCLKVKCKNQCGEIISYNNLTKHYHEECSKIDFKQQYFLMKNERDALINKLNTLQESNDDKNNEFISIKHSHKLFKEHLLSFLCNVCKKVYYSRCSFKCKSCDFNICIQCKEKEVLNKHEMIPNRILVNDLFEEDDLDYIFE